MPAGSLIAARSLAAVGIFIALLSSGAAAGWHHDFSIAQQEAIRQDRPLLVHFYADWCVPCKKMERDVLGRPDFLASVSRHAIPLKLDVDRDPGIAQRYGVESVPTDLFLTPDGRVLGMMNGLRTKEDYLRRVVAIESQYARLKSLYFARSDGQQPLHATRDEAGPRFPTLGPLEESTAPVTTDREPPKVVGPLVKPRADGTTLLGLKGYSPVALYETRAWVKGEHRFAWEHQGLTYLMASAEELEKFQQEAERYAPRLLGCDPVLYYDEGTAVPGSTRFAAYFDKGLYLFTSAATRTTFRDNPGHYTRRRTVLLIDEIESILR